MILHNRRQLKQITDHQHLHATEGPGKITTNTSHTVIDGIEHIGAKHTYFINDEQIKTTQHLLFLLR